MHDRARFELYLIFSALRFIFIQKSKYEALQIQMDINERHDEQDDAGTLKIMNAFCCSLCVSDFPNFLCVALLYFALLSCPCCSDIIISSC